MAKRVLVVDDAMFMRRMVSNMLIEAGYEVVAEGANGEDAIALYSKYKPDFLVMDITMPKVDGLQAVREIVLKYPKAKIVMCSAMGQQPMVMEAIQAGAKGFLVKPIDKQKLIEVLKNLS